MKRVMRWMELTILAISATGCAVTPLTSGGSNVTMYQGASVSLVESCQRLGVLHVTSKKFSGLGRVEDEENKLRNQTAQLGGDSLAITGVTPIATEAMGVAYKCNTPKQ